MKFVKYIALILTFSAFGQGEVGYLFEELPQDSVVSNSLTHHSSVKPSIRQQSRMKSNYARVQALTDLNYFGGSLFSSPGRYRTGLGTEFTSSINDKWYFRVAAIHGLSNSDSIYAPKAYLNYQDEQYTDIRSRIAYTPNEIFNFQAGIDHNFIGEGSRSLFLSDYGKPYPFGLIRARFWRMEYSILYQFMREGQHKNWNNKFASSHHISFNAAKWLNIGIFESVIFQPKDTLLQRGFDAEYLNPLVFYRPQEYSVGSSDNVILGIDATVKWKQHTFYAQFIIDEFLLAEIRARSRWWANKYGGQIGAKGRFKWKNQSFFYRGEFNFVRPYTFAHSSDRFNHGNQGTSLAHPYGANFAELLGELKWQNKQWGAKLFTSYSLNGGDADGFNYGTNIYLPYNNRPFEYGHKIGSGDHRNYWLTSLTLNYRIASHGNINAFVENHLRINAQEKSNYVLVVGVRSQLWNDYRNY